MTLTIWNRTGQTLKFDLLNLASIEFDSEGVTVTKTDGSYIFYKDYTGKLA